MKIAFPYMGNIYIPLRGILTNLGCEVIVPPKPTRHTVEVGVRLSPELMCIPFKITLGNLITALNMGADTIAHVGGSWSCRYGYYARLHQNILRDLGYQFSAMVLRHDQLSFIYKKIRGLHRGSSTQTLSAMLRAFWCGWYKSNLLELVEAKTRRFRAYELEKGRADRLCNHYLSQIDQTFSLAKLRSMKKRIIADFDTVPTDFSRKPLKIKIVGESYCVVEPFINFNLIAQLGAMAIEAEPFLTPHRWLGLHAIRLGRNEFKPLRRLAQPYWRYCVGGEDENSIRHTILAAMQGFDGVIHLHPFACMPGTIVQPVLTKVSKEYNIPVLSLSLDEHTQEIGFYNRIEAFVSLLERRREH